MGYKLKLEIFEGPLDLLLYLIKKDDIDIHDIPISQITEQYMQYISMMKMLDLDVVGDFLVMAATLMQIKSRMLLPPDPNEQPAEEIDPRDELARRLLEYKKFKEIAEALKVKETLRQDFFGRSIDPEALQQLREESREIYYEASLFDLISALSEALKKAPEEVIHEIITEEFTVEKKLHDILHLLLKESSIRLQDLFERSRTKVEIIVTFLAVLELIRLKELIAVQKGVFGEIEIMRNQKKIIPIDEDADDGRAQSDPVQSGN